MSGHERTRAEHIRGGREPLQVAGTRRAATSEGERVKGAARRVRADLGEGDEQRLGVAKRGSLSEKP